MFEASKHPSDEEILKFIDHELPAKYAERLREHLLACNECHKRHASLESRSLTLNEFYDSDPIEVNSTTARIRLQEKLAEHGRDGLLRRNSKLLFHAALPIAAVTTLVAIGLTLYVGKYAGISKLTGLKLSDQYLVPNRSLTPGAVRSVTLNEVCATKDDDLDPSVSSSTKVAVLKEYGLSSDQSAARKFQIDYLVNPQLGGTDDIRNLWPEPYSNGTWNAQAKDVLERHLHQMVCNHAVDLAEAQREIATNWIAAYKKYVGREGS